MLGKGMNSVGIIIRQQTFMEHLLCPRDTLHISANFIFKINLSGGTDINLILEVGEAYLPVHLPCYDLKPERLSNMRSNSQ